MFGLHSVQPSLYWNSCVNSQLSGEPYTVDSHPQVALRQQFIIHTLSKLQYRQESRELILQRGGCRRQLNKKQDVIIHIICPLGYGNMSPLETYNSIPSVHLKRCLVRKDLITGCNTSCCETPEWLSGFERTTTAPMCGDDEQVWTSDVCNN